MLLESQIIVSTSNRKMIVTFNVHNSNIDFLKSHHEGARQKKMCRYEIKQIPSKSTFRLRQKWQGFQMTTARRHRMSLTYETSKE